MRLLLILLTCCLVPAQSQTNGQNASGLKVITVKIKEVRSASHGRSIALEPPKVTPTLGRGTLDATDSAEVAVLKETRNDRSQRERDLRAIGRQDRGSRGLRPPSIRNGYEVRARFTNEGLKRITKVVWSYRPVRNSQIIFEKKFYCQMRFEPGESRSLKVSFPMNILNASFPDLREPAISDFVIEQVEYADGSSWHLPTLVRPFSVTVLPGLEKGKCTPL